MIHNVVDVESWRTVFPLNQLREAAVRDVLARRNILPGEYPDQASIDRNIALVSPGGERVTGPHDIAVVEQLRDEVFSHELRRQRVPTDIFIFNRGEPSRREVTKVGGLPYRSTERPWPHSASSSPMTFIAQFCFVDSQDIVGQLPGDVLLIFGDPDNLWDNDNLALVFEWVRLGEPGLIPAEAVPQTDWFIEPCFGSIYRTWDYLDTDELFVGYQRSYLIPVLEGTKIGGIPRWIQGSEDIQGRFICALGSIDPQLYGQRPFPFINVPDMLDSHEDNYLQWGDSGSLYIFLDLDGQLRWAMQYY